MPAARETARSGAGRLVDVALGQPADGLQGLLRPVVAIGNFDGVHRGHQAVLARARALADRLGRPAVLLTFEPHPVSLFRPDEPFFRLTDPQAKADAAAEAGMDATVALAFDREVAALPAEAFLEAVIDRMLDASGIVAGYDFHFGRGRGGTPQTLVAWGRATGRAVEIVSPFGDGQPISSSAIRAALAEGDVAAAARLLGRPWRVGGIVRHGEKLGRTLGFPTANLALDPGCRLRHGIYAVQAVVDGAAYDAVASFGRRPTFDNGAPLLETFLFDFSGDLYGRRLDVVFVDWLRPELKFDSAQALVAQMQKDVDNARAAHRAAATLTRP